ncbi:hypothetical protein [Spiroplasma endosymbiont of Aspidapion aeneum]|uniref:hypothetical protein n=1 Tax=Spiroplasma endosymbiont of Aspidapion aeneum TaxID=3066276 RepID=UPI00313BF460
MKKIMILLSSISLFVPSTNMLVSCSKAKNPKKETKNDVKFEKSDYTVLLGRTISVNISNFADLVKGEYTKNCSVIIDNPAIAKYVDTQKNQTNKNYQTIQLSGTGAGTTKVTVKFTNLETTDIKEGSFNITVMDFSQYKVTWDIDKKTIDPLAEKIKVGNLTDYQKFSNLDYKDFTINMKSKDEENTDINYLLNGCEVEENGDIYVNVNYSHLPNLSGKDEEYKLGTVTFTLLNTSANYTSNTGDITFNPFKGVRTFTIEKSNNDDIDFKVKKDYDFTVKFKDNIPFSDIQKSKPKITFSNNSDGDFTATPSYSQQQDDVSFTLNIKFTAPTLSYAHGNITIDIRFSSGHFVYYANQSFNYKENRFSPGGKYDKPSDTDIGYTSKYSSTNNAFDDWQTDKPAPQSITITTSANLDDITKAGYTYKDTLTIADNPKNNDDDYYSWSILKNLDLSKEDNAKIFKALDSKTSFSKIAAFSIDNISVGTDNNLTLNINKLTDQVNKGKIHFVSRFYDKVGNVCCATAVFNYAASGTIANNVKFTRGSIPYNGVDGTTNQGDTLSNSIHLTDEDLSFDTFSVSADNKDKLANAAISSDKTDILAVENNLEKKDDNYYIKMKLIGQKGKDVEQGKITLTLTSDGNSFTLDIYYGTYVGKDASSGNYEISNTQTSGSVNYFVSKNAENRSIGVTYQFDFSVDSAPNLEFADGYNYSGSESPFMFNNNWSMVGNVTFDGDINVIGRGVISVSYANIIYGNILFKGNVNYFASNDNSSEASGVISEQYGGIKFNASRISEDKKINFMKDVNIYASSLSGSGTGLINTITTGIIGQVNVEGSVNITNASNIFESVGVIFSKSECYYENLGFDNLKGLTIKHNATINDSDSINLDSSAIIWNCDNFYSPNAVINILGEAGFKSSRGTGPLISSFSNSSDNGMIFAIKEVTVHSWIHNNDTDPVVKLLTSYGKYSDITVNIGDKSKKIDGASAFVLKIFEYKYWFPGNIFDN